MWLGSSSAPWQFLMGQERTPAFRLVFSFRPVTDWLWLGSSPSVPAQFLYGQVRMPALRLVFSFRPVVDWLWLGSSSAPLQFL